MSTSPTDPHIVGHPLLCVCVDCSLVIARAHMDGDAKCGRAWSCGCAACRLARTWKDLADRFERLASLERRHALIKNLKSEMS